MKAYRNPIILALLSLPALASISVAQVLVSLTPTGDAFITGSNPTQNFGSATSVSAAGEQSGYKFYVKFDASSLPGQITSIDSISAYYLSNRSRAANIYLLTNNDGSAVNWNESTLTWDNAPANVTDSYNGLQAGPNQTLTFFANSPGSVDNRDFTITPSDMSSTQALINALNTGERTATLVFVYASSSTLGGFYQIASKESDLTPLTIDVITVPEPSTYALAIGLLAAAGVGFMHQRRR